MANCNAAIESGSESGETLASLYLNRGNLYLVKGQHDAAMTDYDRAIMIAPGYAPARLKRAWINLQMWGYGNAIADYDAILAKEPKMAAALFGRGVAEQLEGDLSQGDEDVAAAKTIDANIEQKFGDVPRLLAVR